MRQLLIFIFFLNSVVVFGQSSPSPHQLSASPYSFSGWEASSRVGIYPKNMLLQVFSAAEEPDKISNPISDWACAYNLDKRSRIVGLGNDGIGFINTGNVQGEEECGSGVVTGKVGAAVLALNTKNMKDIELYWKVRLIEKGDGYPSPRVYRLAGEYKVGENGDWVRFPISTIYSSLDKEEGSHRLYSVTLPEECDDESYIQIRWRYYQDEAHDGGTRPLIGLDDIKVIGLNSRTYQYDPYVFIGEDNLRSFGCVVGTSSQVDSLSFSAMYLEEDLTVKSSGDFYISLNRDGEYLQEINILSNKGSISETKLYIRKDCRNLGEEKSKLEFKSKGFYKEFSLEGKGYHKLYINEVVSSNFMSYYDNISKGYPDWIEIYNPNDEDVSVYGWSLSDNPNDLQKSTIRNSVVKKDSFRLFIANGEALSIDHLSFKLSAYGETVFLVGDDGHTIIDSVTIRPSDTDVSYGREIDGMNNWVFFELPTPGESNNSSIGVSGKSEAPIFSHEGGYYDEPFLLSIQSENPNAKIFYTVDGSDPDPRNLGGTVYEYKQSYTFKAVDLPYYGSPYFRPYRSYLYYEPIDLGQHRTKYFWLGDINAEVTFNPFIPQVKKDFGTIIRAVAVEPGKSVSDIKSFTYFFFKGDSIENKLPVISIILNEKDLKGFYDGIGVPGYGYEKWRNETRPDIFYSAFLRAANYSKRGREAEVPVNIELYSNNKLQVNQRAGMRIHGNTSRFRRHKSFRLYFRNLYGKDRLTYPVFPDLAYEEFNRLLLRNSGNDYLNTFFRDALVQRLMNFSSVDYQEYYPFVVYVNGEYWGLLNARERQDVKYLNRKYGFEDDLVDMFKRHTLLSGDKTHYNELINYIENNDAQDDEVYRELTKQIDIESYIDYQAIKIFAAENDWPGNNIKYWRYKATASEGKVPYGLDGKWRWMNFDNDQSFQWFRLNDNSFEKAISYYNPYKKEGEEPEVWWATTVFRGLMSNRQFKIQFLTRFSDLLNTAYLPNRVINEIDWHEQLLEANITDHINRWGAFTRGGINAWYAQIDSMRSFAEQRPEICYQHMREVFGLKSLKNVNLDVDDYVKGHIKINTIEINHSTPGIDRTKVYPWEGKYFENLPVSFIPIPHDGYKFSHWELTDSISEIDTLVFDLKKNISVKAYFEVDDSYTYNPEPAMISDCPFEFTQWNRKQEEGAIPEHMAFYYTRFPDSRANGMLDGQLDSIRYDHDSKTRINGLGNLGLSLANTNGANKNYYQTRLGAVAVAFTTENIPAAEVSFTLGTVVPKSKKYSIRLQYRLSDKGEVNDFYDNNGNLVEYHGSIEGWHEQRYENIELPKELLGQKYVQLIWRYYYNGQQLDMGSDGRDELRIDDIIIRQKNIVANTSKGTYQNTLIANPNGIAYQWYVCENDTMVKLESEIDESLDISQPGYYAVDISYGECSQLSYCEYFHVKQHKEFYPSIHTSIYPNPSGGLFDLVFDEAIRNVDITLTDIMGRVVDTKKIESAQQVKYDVRNLPSGVYMLNIGFDDGRRSSQKVMIQ